MSDTLWQLLALLVAIVGAVAAALVLPPRQRVIILVGLTLAGVSALILAGYGVSSSKTQSTKSPSNDEQRNSGLQVAPVPDAVLPNSNAKPANTQLCVDNVKLRQQIIAQMGSAASRDFEYATFVSVLVGCKAFQDAVSTADHISSSTERDGVLTYVALYSMKDTAFDVGRASIAKVSSSTRRDVLTSILLNEMSKRPIASGPGLSDPAFPSDVIKLEYGSLGGATYDFRTGRILDEFSPCVRGRASCPSKSSETPANDGWDSIKR